MVSLRGAGPPRMRQPERSVHPGLIRRTGPSHGVNLNYTYPAPYALDGVPMPVAYGCYAFLDGSVRFLQESIDSWALTPGPDGALVPSGWTGGAPFVAGPRAKVGVYQALSSRNG